MAPGLETKWPSRNARGNRRRGRAGICAIPALKKTVRRSGMPSGKKTFARRGALRSCPQSGDRAAAARCPRARSADQVRQIAASIRVSGFTGPVLFAGGNTVIAGAGPCADGAGDGHGQRCPASRWPISRTLRPAYISADKSLAEHAGRDGDLLRPGEIARPRVSSGQMSGCRWLMTGLTCAGPVRPVTPPARPPQERPGTTPWTALPCPPS